MAGVLEADYLVVGAGAAGMAFTDALIDHAEVSVLLLDRRHTVSGHWLDAYPFVRLHQASAFYGVASTLLGGGRTQTSGPETGLHERATAPEIIEYYDRVLHERLLASGKVTFRGGCDYLGDRRFRSLESGEVHEVRVRRAVVDAHYLAPTIPATTPAPFDVDDGARVVPVNDLVRLGGASSQYVIAGAGKTGTDAIIWLLDNGVDPDAIRWVRPRDPWMQNRARIQPDPVSFLATAADLMDAASRATSADDLFLRLEEVELMVRIDRTRTPTMAKTPTLATWELDRLRSIEDVVRLGRIRRVEPGRLLLDDGEVPIAPDAVVVHCAASGLPNPPLVPIWGDGTITVQLIRAAFPSFNAALAGYVEATVDDVAEKNRLCPPTPYSRTPADWALMHVLGGRAASSYGADPSIKAWADGTALNPVRTSPEQAGSAALTAAFDRFRTSLGPGLAGLERIAPEA